MSVPRLEKRRLGYALVTDARLAPFGYLRQGKLRMKSGDENIEFTPDDLRRLADEMDSLQHVRTFVILQRPRENQHILSLAGKSTTTS